MQSLWLRRSEWAVCYKSQLPVRGNNTNNLSEAGVRILKEIVFSRVKAYNVVEIFQFVVDKLESYYQHRILCIAHNRIDRYIQVKFRGLHVGRIFKEDIRPVLEDKDRFLVKSRRDSLTEYRVDMNIGTCSCVAGKDGSPCSHQLAVAINFHRVSLNCIPTFHSSMRRQLACIAIGSEAKSDLSFYAAVSQCADEADQCDMMTAEDDLTSTSLLARIQRLSEDTDSVPNLDNKTEEPDEIPETFLSHQIDLIFSDLKARLKQQDPQFVSGVNKFIDSYKKMNNSTAVIASSLHCFGSHVHGRTVTSVKGGSIRRGRQIPVQATASGRRKYGSKGKSPVLLEDLLTLNRKKM